MSEQTVKTALMECKSPEELAKVVKNNDRESFKVEAESMGIEVTSDHQKRQIADMIISKAVADKVISKDTTTDEDDVKVPEGAQNGLLPEAEEAGINQQVVKINDRLSAIMLDKKLGVIAIVDGKPLHVPGGVIQKNNDGYLIGRF